VPLSIWGTKDIVPYKQNSQGSGSLLTSASPVRNVAVNDDTNTRRRKAAQQQRSGLLGTVFTSPAGLAEKPVIDLQVLYGSLKSKLGQ
jgi:hypothetical protein